MSNKNYNNYFNNNKPTGTLGVSVEEKKELDPIVSEGDENVTITDPVIESDINTELETETEGAEGEGIDSDPDLETHNVQKAKVAVAKLNVRKESNKDSEIIDEVKKDDVLELTESTSVNGFYAIKTATGQNGYCMVDFVELI